MMWYGCPHAVCTCTIEASYQAVVTWSFYIFGNACYSYHVGVAHDSLFGIYAAP